MDERQQATDVIKMIWFENAALSFEDILQENSAHLLSTYIASSVILQTLSLTCTVCGDPKPQVSWFKNDQEVEPGDQYVISLDSGKFASLTIKGVTLEDSGKFTMSVLNKYGGESVDIVVSVYKHGDKIPEIKPSPTPKRIMPPTLPIVIPSAAKPSSPSPAPAPAKTQAPKSPAPSRGVKSPTPSRRK